MFAMSQRRRRPSSPDNSHSVIISPRQTDIPNEKGSSFFKGNGIFSSKRRTSKNCRHPHQHPNQPIDGSLPAHYSAAGGVGSTPTSNACEFFLMGGQFYPGKDKVRRHIRRKTIWYRVFCSSPGKIVFTVVMVGYILLWHVSVPLTDLLLECGRQLSANVDLLVPKIEKEIEDKLISVSFEKSQAQRVQEDRNKLLHGSANQILGHLKLFEQRVPKFYDFYHGKDDDSEKTEQKIQVEVDEKTDDADMSELSSNDQGDSDEHHAREKDQKGQSQSSDEKVNIHREQAVENHNLSKNNHRDPNAKNDKSASSNEDQNNLPGSTLEKDHGKSKRTLRILQNMDAIPSESSCLSNLSSDDISTTLIVQCSIDRMWILKETCTRWKDPIVAVIFMPSSSSAPKEWKKIAYWGTICPQITIIPHIASPEDEKYANYPVNMLRNIALDAAKTSHILVADVDFLPSMNLHKSIRTALDKSGTAADEKQALVIPAFERIPPEPCVTKEDCAAYLQMNSSFIPHSFYDLKKCIIGDKLCDVFQRKINWEGHYSTQSDSWLKGNWYQDTDGDKKVLKSIDCFDSLRYEPYVVVRWCPISSEKYPSSSSTKAVAPYYDERFHGYGKNKIQMVSHLRYMGYTFSILPDGFIVHNPHPESNAKKVWNNKKDNRLHYEMDKLYPQFLGELAEKYRNKTKRMVGLCKHMK